MKAAKVLMFLALAAFCAAAASAAQDPWKPYGPPCVERENVFAFAQKPSVKLVSKDRYEITFAVKGNCDVAVAIVEDEEAVAGGNGNVAGRPRIVRHLGSGVLGANAPKPFRKNSLKQTIYWNGQDDLQAYVKEPERLRVRVMLGLKPAFERLLGDAGPYNLFGYVWGIAIDQDAAYVFAKGSGNGQLHLRTFDRDGKYLGRKAAGHGVRRVRAREVRPAGPRPVRVCREPWLLVPPGGVRRKRERSEQPAGHHR